MKKYFVLMICIITLAFASCNKEEMINVDSTSWTSSYCKVDHPGEDHYNIGGDSWECRSTTYSFYSDDSPFSHIATRSMYSDNRLVYEESGIYTTDEDYIYIQFSNRTTTCYIKSDSLYIMDQFIPYIKD